MAFTYFQTVAHHSEPPAWSAIAANTLAN
jgi:hypothetical protein